MNPYKIVVSNFALGRHFIGGLPYSFCSIRPEELLSRVNACFALRKLGYREGVVLVPITNVSGILSPVVRITDENKHLLRAVFEPRREGEAPRKKIVIDAPKSQARFVDVVLYHHDVLKEGNENSDLTADWEVVSINARLDEKEPMSVGAMARNMGGLAGGTKGEYTAKELVESINYWADKAMATR
jgi:hypothetical protein